MLLEEHQEPHGQLVSHRLRTAAALETLGITWAACPVSPARSSSNRTLGITSADACVPCRPSQHGTTNDKTCCIHWATCTQFFRVSATPECKTPQLWQDNCERDTTGGRTTMPGVDLDCNPTCCHARFSNTANCCGHLVAKLKVRSTPCKLRSDTCCCACGRWRVA